MTSDSPAPPEELAILPVTTTAIWLFCLMVGIAGLILHYPHPAAPVAELPPMQAVLVNVEIAGSPQDQPPAQQPPELKPPDAASITHAPASPQLIPVAAPISTIAFARTVVGPTTIVSARQAAPITNGPPVQQLVFGSDAGRQPKPDYPREAALAHQEGTVLVRFTVDESGQVVSASVVKPSPFALLDQSAARTIRDEWRFPAGAVRVYEVSITFQLK